MSFRIFLGLLAALAVSTSASAQFYSFGPRGVSIGGYPPGYPPMPSGLSIRSPFFRMELSPYGGRYDTPYSSFRVPSPVPPPSRFDVYAPRFDSSRYDSPLEELRDQLQGRNTVIVPAPPVPPEYNVPSFSDVFPDESQDPSTAAGRIGNRLQRAVDQLEKSLSGREESRIWTDYLRLDEISLFSAQLAEQPTLTKSMQVEAESLLVNFDAVSVSSDLSWLKSTAGFADIRATLTDLSKVVAADGKSVMEQQVSPGTVEPEAVDPQIEDLPAPPAMPINKPKRVFRAEL